jgi:hypothetical protein
MTAGDAPVVLAMGLAVMDVFGFCGCHYCSFLFTGGFNAEFAEGAEVFILSLFCLRARRLNL